MRAGSGGETAVRILEVEPDLAVGLSEDELDEATSRLVARTWSFDWTTQRGRWGPPNPTECVGLLVAEGLLLREVRLLDTVAAELLGRGDVLRPWDSDGEVALPVPAEVRLTAFEPLTVAVLDASFLRRAGPWPTVVAAIAGRAVGRAMSMTLNDAITNLKRVDVRLLLLFWHLAERWGRVRMDMIAIPLPLTHETLAKLVGAARPSVTTAIGSLGERGLLHREGKCWVLSRDAKKAFGDLSPPSLSSWPPGPADPRSAS